MFATEKSTADYNKKNYFIQRVYRGNNKRTWQSLIYIYPSETHDKYIWIYMYIDTWRWKLHFLTYLRKNVFV